MSKHRLLSVAVYTLAFLSTPTSYAETGHGEYFEASKSPPKEVAPEHTHMDNHRLHTLIKKIDQHASGRPGFWRLEFKGYTALVITDEGADRMRIISEVAEVDSLDEKRLIRMMQANFDSALDARYAIAKGVLWSAFISPLSSLSDKSFYSGLGQVINLAATYGKSYSSGALMFKGGDSGELNRELFESLIEKSQSI